MSQLVSETLNSFFKDKSKNYKIEIENNGVPKVVFTGVQADAPLVPSLIEETGEFFLSLYGAEFAFGWRGDAAFMRRTENLVFNYSLSTGKGYTIKDNIITPKFNYIYDGFCYVLTSIETLLAGLTVFFEAQIINNKEYPPEIREEVLDEEGEVVEIKWDNAALFDLAYERAEEFYNTRIIQHNFMYGIQDSSATIFVVGGGDRSESTNEV